MFLSLLADIGLGAAYFTDQDILAIDLRGMRDRARKKSLRRYKRRILGDAKRQRGAHDTLYKQTLPANPFFHGALAGLFAKECFEHARKFSFAHSGLPSAAEVCDCEHRFKRGKCPMCGPESRHV
jgi:hypothetical protein